MKKKTIALLLACVMALGVAIGGTMAWLTDDTGEVVNTFTIGDINIKLEETGTTPDGESNDVKKEYHFVPGDTHTKDPIVGIRGDSEDCWVFVKVEVENNDCSNVNPLIEWAVAEGWTPCTNNSGAGDGVYCYYRTVVADDLAQTAADAYKEYQVLACKKSTAADHVNCEGCITISPEITKDMVTAINGAKPSITFEAYAHQSQNTDFETAKTSALEYFGITVSADATT